MSDLSMRFKELTTNGLFVAIVLGLLIRLLFIPFLLEIDSNFWVLVVRNIESGNGLYLMEGYYYTPIWGYILGFVAGIQNSILDIGDLSVICYDLISYYAVDQYSYTDMAASIVFLFLLKVILWVSDLVLSITVYHLVKDRTGDEKKAIIAFLLVFICPHVIGSSSVIVMPDTISAMFTVVTIMMMRKDRYFLAGICYSFAVWVKFFPLAIVLVLLSYIYIKVDGEGRIALKRMALSLAGFLVASFVLFFPQIMEGTLDRSLAFFTDRISETISYGIVSIILALVSVAFAGLVTLFVVRHMLTASGNLDDRVMEYSMVILCVCMLLFTNMQYVVTLMPFLVYCIMVVDQHYKYIWTVLAIAGVILTFMLNTNVVMLNSLVAYTGVMSTETVLAIFDFLNTGVFFGMSIVDIFCSIGTNLQKIILFCILPLFIIRRMIINNKIPRWHHER